MTRILARLLVGILVIGGYAAATVLFLWALYYHTLVMAIIIGIPVLCAWAYGIGKDLLP